MMIAEELPSPMHSVEHYRSQFIKEGLKMKVKQKMGAASKGEELRAYYLTVYVLPI